MSADLSTLRRWRRWLVYQWILVGLVGFLGSSALVVSQASELPLRVQLLFLMLGCTGAGLSCALALLARVQHLDSQHA